MLTTQINDLYVVHMNNYRGHCWTLKSNSQFILNSLKSQKLDVQQGPCKHGAIIQTQHGHGYTYTEYGNGESQVAPFTELDEIQHMNVGGHCYSIEANAEMMKKMDEQAASHHTTTIAGPCKGTTTCTSHGGVKYCSTAEGSIIASDIIELQSIQVAPFTELDEIQHMNVDGHCYSIEANAEMMAKMDKEAAAHHTPTIAGPCKGATTCSSHGGVKYCSTGEGSIVASDIIELESIHVYNGDVCYDLSGPAASVNPQKKQAEAHGLTVEGGKCTFKDTPDCRKWRGMTTCHTAPLVMAWGGADIMHATHGKYCIQVRGNPIKDAAIDKAIADKAAQHDMKVVNGSCKSAGFDQDVKDFNHIGHGVHASIWMH